MKAWRLHEYGAPRDVLRLEDVPTLLFGNFSLLGVCHAYVDDPLAFRRQTGFNFPSHEDGARVHDQVLELLRCNAIRPVIGQRAAFAELPAALDAVARRETVGRTVIALDR